MPTYLCRPKANYSNTGWKIFGSTSLWEALVSEDDATTYIGTVTPSKVYHADLDHPLIGTASASTMYIRARCPDGAPTVTYGTSLAGVFTTDVDTYAVPFSWAQDSFTLTPAAGDVNQEHFGVGIETDATNPQDTRVSWVRLDLVYDPPGGEGFAYLIGSFLGPLVAVGLHEMPGLIRHFNAEAASRPWWHPWNRHRLLPEEAERAWLALRAHPWRTILT